MASHINMSRLLRLPDEILLKIIYDTCPDGTEDLILCCRRLYNISDNILETHRMRKKKYGVVRWPPTIPAAGGYQL